MPSNSKSPYTTSFKSAIKRGIPAGVAVAGIAKRTNKSPSTILASLYKEGLCYRQKVNGQWIYWPCEAKRSATQAKACQSQMWQSFIDWCISSGACKPELLEKNSGSQKEFMTYCRKFFNGQITGVGSSSSTKSTRRSTSRPKTRLTASSRRTTSSKSSYPFPRASKSTSRRYRKAA